QPSRRRKSSSDNPNSNSANPLLTQTEKVPRGSRPPHAGPDPQLDAVLPRSQSVTLETIP
ncbi:MAG: hypothetical protein ACK57U_13320, partial [Planctomycetota bacterium]